MSESREAGSPGPEVAADSSPSGSPTAQPAPPGGLLRWLLRLPAYLFKARLGFLMGHRFLLLVHTGRRSGVRRETVLEVVRYDRSRREAVVAAGWGRKTQWLHNVEAGLAREVLIGRERFVPAYRVLDLEEAQAVLEAYERHSGLPVGLVRSVLSRLLGWRYDGSREARLRAARQLPLLGFRPAQTASSETRPVEMERTETPPGGTAAAEIPPAEMQRTEPPPVKTPPAETPPARTPSGGTAADDTPSAPAT